MSIFIRLIGYICDLFKSPQINLIVDKHEDKQENKQTLSNDLLPINTDELLDLSDDES